MKKNWFTSLFTDADWDLDCTKVIGFILVVVGIIGFFTKNENFKWLILTGAGALASGKLSGNE